MKVIEVGIKNPSGKRSTLKTYSRRFNLLIFNISSCVVKLPCMIFLMYFNNYQVNKVQNSITTSKKTMNYFVPYATVFAVCSRQSPKTVVVRGNSVLNFSPKKSFFNSFGKTLIKGILHAFLPIFARYVQTRVTVYRRHPLIEFRANRRNSI